MYIHKVYEYVPYTYNWVQYALITIIEDEIVVDHRSRKLLNAGCPCACHPLCVYIHCMHMCAYVYILYNYIIDDLERIHHPFIVEHPPAMKGLKKHRFILTAAASLIVKT